MSPDDNGVLNTRYTSCPPPRRADGCSDLCEPAAFHQSHAMQGSVGAAFYWTSGRNTHTAAFMQGILETAWPSENEREKPEEARLFPLNYTQPLRHSRLGHHAGSTNLAPL